MSLLTIVQRAAKQTRLFEAPLTVIANTDSFVAQSQELLFEIGEELKELYDWEQLVKLQTFNTVSSQESYAISTIVSDNDFGAFVGNTFWDRTNLRECLIVDYSRYQWLKSGLGTSAGIDKNIAQYNENIHIYPVPGSADTLSFYYKSDYWIKSSGGTPQSDWLSDSDTSFFPEYLLQLGLRFKLLQANGLPYEDEYQSYVNRRDAEAEKSKPKQTIGMKRFTRYPVANIPESGFGV